MKQSDTDRLGIPIAEQAAIGTLGNGGVSLPGTLATRLVAKILDLDIAKAVLESGTAHTAEIREISGKGEESILGIGHHHSGIERVLDATRLGVLKRLEDPFHLDHDRWPFWSTFI